MFKLLIEKIIDFIGILLSPFIHVGASPTSPNPKILKSMPIELQEYIKQLENWAEENLKESKKEKKFFCIFKITALIGTIFAGLFGYYKLNIISPIFGGIGVLFMIIEGFYPVNVMEKIHSHAHHDIRELEIKICNDWNVEYLNTNDCEINKNKIASKIIKKYEREFERISKNIRDMKA